jgi:hypothetical protein
MKTIRFFTDEDVYGAIAPALRDAGFDALSTPEAGRLGESDESQLIWAVSRGYLFVTFNVGHFANLHADWIRRHQHHAGIVVSQQRPLGDMLRRLLHLAESVDADEMADRLVFVGDW